MALPPRRLDGGLTERAQPVCLEDEIRSVLAGIRTGFGCGEEGAGAAPEETDREPTLR